MDLFQQIMSLEEYYLTDCPGILKGWGETVRALPVLKPCVDALLSEAGETPLEIVVSDRCGGAPALESGLV